MQFSKPAIVCLSILLSACATPYPRSGEDQATYHANNAQTALEKGDCTAAAMQIHIALTRPTGNTKIKELFAKNPKSRDCYYAYLEKRNAEIADAHGADEVFENLSSIKATGVFVENQTSALFGKLQKMVTEGNLSGSVPFVLGDNLDNFPALKSPPHQEIIRNRSIAILQGNGAALRRVAALMEYVQRVGVDSAEGKRIENLLPTLNIRRDEIDAVAKVFPQFAAARKAAITVRVFFQVKNGDRLLSDDLLQMLRSRAAAVEWVPAAGPNVTTVVVERLRNDEKTTPERSQTITYARYEVNTISAVLLMPREASYLYEVVSGGTEIEYGYVVSAVADGKTILDEVVRGKVGGEYRRCQNERIQNVFGGVSSAGFIANDDMQSRCSGPSSISVEDLRKEVLTKVMEGVLDVPTIKAAQDLN
jgi:hypothetical protein